MTIVRRSMLLSLVFLMASVLVISVGFVAVTVVLIFLMQYFPALQLLDIKVYHILVFLSIIGFYMYTAGWLIGKPSLAVVGWMKGLSEGQYDSRFYGERYSFLWRKKDKIKLIYIPFKDMIVRLQELTATLDHNRQELEQANELREQWISGVSHDIKTPLSYIKGYLDVMVSPQIELAKEEKERIFRLLSQKVQEIEGLIRTFQFKHGKPRVLKARSDLVRFLRELTLDAANNPKSAACQFSFESQVSALPYYFDAKLLKRAVQNILMNAVLHNPPETSITVQVRTDQNIQIIITDNGVGMPSEVVQRFDHRQPGDLQDKDEGIGLFVVKDLIEEHRGELQVHSRPNRGTTVTILLPLDAVR
ncbi:HAMP domain-containing histidine kinase [Paenibacillus faecis]|uniref:histidine kinase n=1 Tax=Paenibacillus faecis TaxID=862114 RepID=A0A5D0D0L7_9BACL|nr:HAMP domain-containing sensor histidine kinase [Paenibacillus faecis]TYA14667.1 HAMP domain-containing histidine kinase [Paenibacillus faecis]